MCKALTTFIILIASLGVSGCERGASTAVALGDFGLDQGRAEAYLKLHQIGAAPAGRVERALRNLVERTAMAEVIATQEWGGRRLASAEVMDRRNEILIERYFEEVTGSAVRDEMIAEHYRAHASEYAVSSARVARILIAVPRDAGQVQQDERMAFAKRLAAELQGGVDFAAAAREHSDDAVTRAKGGEIGWLVQGQILDPALAAALQLKPGEVSPPVRGERGIEIVKLLEPVKIEPQPLEQVKERIRYQLQYEAKLKEMDRLKQLAADRIAQHLRALNLSAAPAAEGE